MTTGGGSIGQGTLDELLDFYAFMIQANGLVARTEDLDALFVDLCRLGIHLDRRLVLAWIGMIEAGAPELRIVASAGPAVAYLDGLHVALDPNDERGRGPTGRTLREGRCVVVNRFLQEATTAPWHAAAKRFGIEASVAVPLRRGGSVCGALMLYANAPDLFDTRIVGELEVVSQTISHAIDRAAEREARRVLDSQLLESRQTLRAVLDAAHQSIMMLRPNGETLVINRAGAARLGLTPQEVIGRNMFGLLPPALAASRRVQIDRVLATGQAMTMEDERDGRSFRSTIVSLPDHETRVVIYAEETTEQRRAEAAARAADRQFREVVDLAGEGIVSLDATGVVLFANPRMHDMVGVPPGSLVGRSAAEFVFGDSLADLGERLARIRSGVADSLQQVTYRLRRVNGDDFTALISAAVRTDDSGRQEGLVAVITDISDLLHVQQALRDALRVVEASPVVCFRWLAKPGWPVEYVSPNISRWGWSVDGLLAGNPPFSDLVHPDDLGRVSEEVEHNTAAGAVEYVQEYRLRTPEGRYFWVEDSTRVVRDAAGAVVCYEGVVSDVDATRRHEQDLAAALAVQRALNEKLESAQNQLIQSEKMASIGQLAAGVAHEINNPIGFVTSNIGTLGVYLRDLFTLFEIVDRSAATAANPADFTQYSEARRTADLDYLRSDITQLMAESKEGLERVRKIVQDLKDFSRVGEASWQWADLHPGLDATLNIVWNELKYKCTVRKEYGTLPQIFCLPSQLNQVFMNLLVNAAQAIDSKGEVVIHTETVGDDRVRVIISDTGRGIPPENLSRIFDPFFTTKPVGKGTGLGLSLAWGIIRRHGGTIEVESVVGQGTRFIITLPVQPPAEATDLHAIAEK